MLRHILMKDHLVAVNVTKSIRRNLRETIMRLFVVYHMNFHVNFHGVTSRMLTQNTMMNICVLSIALRKMAFLNIPSVWRLLSIVMRENCIWRKINIS